MYVVEYKPTGEYLTEGYWKGIKSNLTMFLGEAHRFSALELKLASKTILINRKNYRVYKIDR